MRQWFSIILLTALCIRTPAMATPFVIELPNDDSTKAVLAGVSELRPTKALYFMDSPEFEVEYLAQDRYGRPQVIIYDNYYPQTLSPIAPAKTRIAIQKSKLVAGDVILWDTDIAGIPYAQWLDAEHDARKAKRGVWKDITIHPATPNVPEGALEVVRGTIVDAQRRNGNIYINFGEDWREDFTLFMPKHYAKDVQDETLSALIGKTVLARGTVYDYYGPMVDLYRLEMLEIIE